MPIAIGKKRQNNKDGIRMSNLLERTKEEIVKEMCFQLGNISNRLRGLQLDNIEQFERLRHEWAEVGVALAGHIKYIDDKEPNAEENWNRAMKALREI